MGGSRLRWSGGYTRGCAERWHYACLCTGGLTVRVRGHLRHLLTCVAGCPSRQSTGCAAQRATDPALDYEAMTTEEWFANCSACCVPEIGGALTRARIAYKVISGALIEDERAWDEIEAWCRAAGAASAARHARLGFLGHTYPGDVGYVFRLHSRSRSTGQPH